MFSTRNKADEFRIPYLIKGMEMVNQQDSCRCVLCHFWNCQSLGYRVKRPHLHKTAGPPPPSYRCARNEQGTRHMRGLHRGSLPTLNPLPCCAEQGYFLFPTVRVSPILSFPHIFLHTALAPRLLSGPQLQLNKANTRRLPNDNQNEMNGL